MDKDDKQRRLREWKQARRAEERARLPLPDPALQALFAMLEAHLAVTPCDHSRKVTEAWLVDHGHDLRQVGLWLERTGGYCDCEVLDNSEDVWRQTTD